MANKLNQLICATSYGNTGYGECILDPTKFEVAIQVPKAFELEQSDVDDLLEILKTKIHAVIGTRIFPYPVFIQLTDNTEDETVNTTDYGAKIKIKDGFYDLTFRYENGGVLLHGDIKKNEGKGKNFLFVDDNNILYGYKSGTKLKGIPVDQFIVKPFRLNTGAESALYQLRFIINPKYLNGGNLGFLKISDFNFTDLMGLQDVTLELVSLASNVATVKARTKISSVDLHEAYASNLAATTAWRAENQDGTAVAITTVTNNVAAGGWDITFSSTPFNAADKVYLKLALPSVLRAAPIEMEGFDSSEALEIEAPAS